LCQVWRDDARLRRLGFAARAELKFDARLDVAVVAFAECADAVSSCTEAAAVVQQLWVLEQNCLRIAIFWIDDSIPTISKRYERPTCSTI
jgi:hypothetical protein